jgi:VWFA-related protein
MRATCLTATLKLGLVAVLAASTVLQASGPIRQSQTSSSSEVLWFFLIDDLHFQFTETGRVREQLRTIAAALVREGDLVGAASTGPSSIEVDLTHDRERLERAFSKTSGAALQGSDLVKLSRQPSGQFDERVYRADVALMTAVDVAKHLEQVQHKRKAFVYLSSGYEFDPPPESTSASCRPVPPPTTGGFSKSTDLSAVQDCFAALTAQANRSNVRVFALAPAGLPNARRDPNVPEEWWQKYVAATERSLSVMSQRTGGFALLANAELESGLKQIASAMRR